MNIVVIHGSSRDGGNTEQLTNALFKDIPHTSIHLREYHIQPIVDQRHDPGGFDPVEDDYQRILHQVLAHDLLVFATPLYWYGMSGHMKIFIDRWSQSLRDRSLQFKAEMSKKQAFVIIVGGDHPSQKALPLVRQFQYIFDFIHIPLLGYVIGEGTRPGEVNNDHRAFEQIALWREKFRCS